MGTKYSFNTIIKKHAIEETNRSGEFRLIEFIQRALNLNWVSIPSVTIQNVSGEVKMFAGATAPTGWKICDGDTLLIASFPDLYAVIGTTYGGDGITTFALPDLRGRTVVGAGTGAGLTARTLGDEIGEEDIALVTAELPSHTHGATGLLVAVGAEGKGVTPSNTATNNWLGDATGAYRTSGAVSSTLNSAVMKGSTASAGSGTAHENVQPSLVLNYIIAC